MQVSPVYLRLATLCLLQLGWVYSALTQAESWYISQIASALDGETEVPVENGRVDVVTEEYAIEVERAVNWKHSIGQSLWYALQTNKKPGIVLLITEPAERKNGIRLQSALDFAGIGDKVRVWFYPEDFVQDDGGIQHRLDQKIEPEQPVSQYWITHSSNIRHNTSCTYFANSKGRYAAKDEGKPCGRCGG